MSDDGKIECMLCGSREHYIPRHLKDAHPGMTKEDYQAAHPDAPLASQKFLDAAKKQRGKKQEKEQQREQMMQMAANVVPIISNELVEKAPLHEVFDMPFDDSVARMNNTKHGPVMIDVLINVPDKLKEMVPAIDEGYVFDPVALKHALMALQLNIPLLNHGPHGTGKTTFIEQICARTNRPLLRVQHTETTEEAHILGQMVVRNQATEFDEGPLVDAMRHGIVYLADEYDIAHPGVHAVYQPVLEGKNLFIKEAPPSQRLITPHELFRFIATGNTNGSGDDTGLYSGTKIGNAANYSRFGVTIEMKYPESKTEVDMLIKRFSVPKEDAESLVDVAGRIREQYYNSEVSLPISTRELIRVATLALAMGGMWRAGFELAYTNRLSPSEAEAVLQTVQRVLG